MANQCFGHWPLSFRDVQIKGPRSNHIVSDRSAAPYKKKLFKAFKANKLLILKFFQRVYLLSRIALNNPEIFSINFVDRLPVVYHSSDKHRLQYMHLYREVQCSSIIPFEFLTISEKASFEIK
ncbi:hypothetical protein BpHYR1_011594 [Brachionus plicatilis]|uniref:Uncharacterized protein n=1 Tax=Brachionus plicatilis TaxID=10195 RepID=A0A3M7S2J5_BRAPC|nr:hypothetical protein BpHYR1_011594 [Brachionus plicatilis]